jgi:ABC-type Fe3+ transport system permease subunit
MSAAEWSAILGAALAGTLLAVPPALLLAVRTASRTAGRPTTALVALAATPLLLPSIWPLPGIDTAWLGGAGLALVAATPFVLLPPALSAARVPLELQEMAAVIGMRPGLRFRLVLWPILRAPLAIGMLLGFLRAVLALMAPGESGDAAWLPIAAPVLAWALLGIALARSGPWGLRR